MTLVFPIERAATATRDALGLGFFWFATVLLSGAFIGELVLSLAVAEHPLWLALPSLTLVWVGALVLRSFPATRWFLVLLIVAVMLAGVFWFTNTIAYFSEFGNTSASVFLTWIKLAVVMTCAMADRWSGGAVGSIAGYVLAESIVLIGVLGTTRAQVVDVPAILVTLGMVLALTLLRLSRERARRVEEPLADAGVAGIASRERQLLTLRSSALVHDTILNELATLATTRPGPVSPAVLSQIATSLQLVAATEAPPSMRSSPEVTGAMLAIIERQRGQGLAVAVSGDLLGLESLSAAVAEAFEQAIEQCLVNVLRHSGTDAAELVFFVGAENVTVMVTDSGVGFDPDTVAPDRMGLRDSVRGRIASVGGTVSLWSSPGAGTSIVLTVPREVHG